MEGGKVVRRIKLKRVEGGKVCMYFHLCGKIFKYSEYVVSARTRCEESREGKR